MLDRWYKISAIVASVVVITAAIVGPSVAGMVWAIRMDDDVADLKRDVASLQTDVASLQTDVSELQADVSELRTDVDQLQVDVADIKETQLLILESVNRIETALTSHTHDADGRMQVSLKR